MTMSNSVHIRLPSAIRDGVFVLLFIVGGGKKSAELHWRRALADFIVVFDNPKEIAAMQAEFGTRDNIAYFALAEGETADTLAQFGTAEQQGLIKDLGSMNASSGLGQTRGVGHLAGLKLSSEESLKQFIARLRSEIGIRTKGRPAGVLHRNLGSGAGGTFSGAIEEISRVVQEGVKIAGVSYDVEFDMIDATTFLGLGERCGRNAAATILELAALCYTKDGKPLDGVKRSLAVMALPPMRHDSAARYKLVALDEQAIMCSEMQSMLALVRPNHALDGPLGVIEYRQVDFFRTLDDETEVANEVAYAYLPALEEGLQSAVVVRGLLDGVFTDTSATPAIRQELDHVLEDLAILSDEDLILGIERPAEVLHCHATAETASGERFLLERLDEEFLIPATTLTLAVERLCMLRTIERGVNDEMAVVAESLHEQNVQYLEARRVFDKALHRVRYPRFWHCSTNAGRWDRLVAATYSLRAARDSMRPTEAVLAALQRALVVVQRVLQAHLRHLESIHRAMQSFRPRGYTVPTERSVEIRNIDDAFAELSLLPGAERSRQTWILSSQAVFVTLHGLSRILQSDEPRLDLIADRIINGPPVHIGPYPGASRHKEGGREVYCLPAMMPVPRRELKELLEQRMPNVTVVFTDFLAAGINVLRYRFFRPRTVNELFPGMLERDLRDAINDELKPLYFPHGDERLIALGVPTGSSATATTEATGTAEEKQNEQCRQGN